RSPSAWRSRSAPGSSSTRAAPSCGRSADPAAPPARTLTTGAASPPSSAATSSTPVRPTPTGRSTSTTRRRTSPSWPPSGSTSTVRRSSGRSRPRHRAASSSAASPPRCSTRHSSRPTSSSYSRTRPCWRWGSTSSPCRPASAPGASWSPPPEMDGQDRPYLFPVPAAVLRGGLNLRAQLGAEISEDEAVCDTMLDLDRMDARHPPAQRLQKLHSVRYYAERWGWSKSQVQRGLSGDKRRGLPAFLIERARGFRAFFGRPANPESRPDSPRPGDGFGDSGGHPGDSGGQKAAYSMRSGPIWGQGGDSGGHPGDKEDQTTNTLVGGVSSARAREGGSSPSRGQLYEHPAVRAYERAAEVQAPVLHAEAVARHFRP